jgi:hypothetical protein
VNIIFTKHTYFMTLLFQIDTSIPIKKNKVKPVFGIHVDYIETIRHKLSIKK